MEREHMSCSSFLLTYRKPPTGHTKSSPKSNKKLASVELNPTVPLSRFIPKTTVFLETIVFFGTEGYITKILQSPE
jgi:hypothetical protein